MNILKQALNHKLKNCFWGSLKLYDLSHTVKIFPFSFIFFRIMLLLENFLYFFNAGLNRANFFEISDHHYRCPFWKMNFEICSHAISRPFR